MDVHEVYLMLGGNHGDVAHTLAGATSLIELHIGKIIRCSSLYLTAPWGFEEQPPFLNQALLVHTHLEPMDILEKIHKIEKQLGRKRNHLNRYDSRTIDLDILLYDDRILQTEMLQIPHPRMSERNFVLIPMEEIAADKLHPELNKTISELRLLCTDMGAVKLKK